MRDDFLCVLDIQPHLILAGVGVGEVIARPAVEIVPRVALRQGRPSGSATPASEYLVGQALQEAERSGEQLDIIWPLVYADERDVTAPSDPSLQAQSEDAIMDTGTGSMVSTVGKDNKGKGRQNDGVRDWIALEVILRHIIVTRLGLSAKPVNYMFLVALPPTFSISSHETLARVFFERLGVSNLLFIDRAVTQLYSCASLMGAVVDVGPRYTHISVINDTTLHAPSSLICDVGEDDCDAYLAYILVQANPDLPKLLQSSTHLHSDHGTPSGSGGLAGEALFDALRPIIQVLKDGEYLKFTFAPGSALHALVDGSNGPLAGEAAEEEEGITDVAKALASGKIAKLMKGHVHDSGVTVITEGDRLLLPHPSDPSAEPINIGPERHRFADPLFDPSVLAKVPFGNARSKASVPSLQEVVAASIGRLAKMEDRYNVWESIVLTGGMAGVKGLAQCLVSSLHRYAADCSYSPVVQAALAKAHSEQDNAQPVHSGSLRVRAKHQKTPEYFSEYRDRPDLTGFLGGCIYAKMGFMESQGGEWMTKQAYNQYGPSIARLIAV